MFFLKKIKYRLTKVEFKVKCCTYDLKMQDAYDY